MERGLDSAARRFGGGEMLAEGRKRDRERVENGAQRCAVSVKRDRLQKTRLCEQRHHVRSARSPERVARAAELAVDVRKKRAGELRAALQRAQVRKRHRGRRAAQTSYKCVFCESAEAQSARGPLFGRRLLRARSAARRRNERSAQRGDRHERRGLLRPALPAASSATHRIAQFFRRNRRRHRRRQRQCAAELGHHVHEQLRRSDERAVRTRHIHRCVEEHVARGRNQSARNLRCVFHGAECVCRG
mmetsp:Transcript_10993/g.29517  ORF Transcript_10993/g.29517 Transcript_10993/m.29517 type:complete len:246 (+) Transcript_10993:655-1392(+)